MGDKANKISLHNIQELFWLFVAHRTCPEGFLVYYEIHFQESYSSDVM